jgi:hypothetical protein
MSASARTLDCIRADASVLPPSNFITDATVRPSHGRPCGHRPIVRPSVCPSIRYRLHDNPETGCPTGARWDARRGPVGVLDGG